MYHRWCNQLITDRHSLIIFFYFFYLYFFKILKRVVNKFLSLSLFSLILLLIFINLHQCTRNLSLTTSLPLYLYNLTLILLKNIINSHRMPTKQLVLKLVALAHSVSLLLINLDEAKNIVRIFFVNSSSWFIPVIYISLRRRRASTIMTKIIFSLYFYISIIVDNLSCFYLILLSGYGSLVKFSCI